MRQTLDSYLWLTIINGLGRFDGLRFRVFNKVNTVATAANRFAFFALYKDHSGLFSRTPRRAYDLLREWMVYGFDDERRLNPTILKGDIIVISTDLLMPFYSSRAQRPERHFTGQHTRN